jgi:serine/threonine protein kinase
MRSQETRPGAVAVGLDEWSRTLAIDPMSLRGTGHFRPRTVGIADSSRPRGRPDGTIESNSFSTDPWGGVTRGSVDPTATAADRIVAGRYRLSTLLGAGGMGAVWLAEDAVLRRAVALKKLTHQDREDRSGALQEARAAARLTHPGVVRVHDVVLEDDEEWIVMEALSGEPLSGIIHERGRLPVEEVAQLGLQLLSALQAIHDADLVHRDIKPSNIQICGDGRVVITDFGLSSPPGVWGGLRDGSMAGSLSYMAPETLIDGIFGPPSDLYAFGVTLYTAVEGHPPFDPLDPLSLVDWVLSAQPEPARHAGPLGEVLDGLLDKDPERRMDAARARERLQATALVTTAEPYRFGGSP